MAGNNDKSEGHEERTSRKREHEEMEEDTITLGQFLEQHDEMQDLAAAVLGGSDDKNCSYDQGYVVRQALYSCLTCNPVDGEPYVPAGICLACSIKCHSGHDLVELYTKRNFRCDCGNKSSPSTKCSLQPNKSDYNSDNTYNHNFKGLYCVCERPYPDEEDEDGDDDDDEMLQCIFCEDWFHGRHTDNDYIDLGNPLIETSELICKACTAKCGFLQHYEHLLLKAEHDDSNSSENPEPEQAELISLENPNSSVANEIGAVAPKVALTDKLEEAVSQTVDFNNEGNNEEKSIGKATCYLVEHPEKIQLSGGSWWIKGWRRQICHCEACLAEYNKIGVSFLLNPKDALEAYEAIGREKEKEDPISGEHELMQALSHLDRIQQLEVVHSYNELREGLLEFMQRIGASGRSVLTRQDVLAFFEELHAKKRQRLQVHVPDNCR